MIELRRPPLLADTYQSHMPRPPSGAPRVLRVVALGRAGAECLLDGAGTVAPPEGPVAPAAGAALSANIMNMSRPPSRPQPSRRPPARENHITRGTVVQNAFAAYKLRCKGRVFRPATAA